MFCYLNDDVTRNILSFCDLDTVLAFGQASKYCHELAFTSREVWFPFASELYTRGYIDLAPGHTLYNRTVQELVFLIKRVGFLSHITSFTQASLGRPSSLLPQQVTFPLHENPLLESRPSRQVISVPGGKYVLIRYQDRMKLEAWSVWEGRLVWSSDNHSMSTSDWDRIDSVEARMDGDVLVMLLWLRKQPLFPANNIPSGYALKLLELDLKASSSKTTTLLDFSSNVDRSGCLPLRLDEDFAVGYGTKNLALYRRSTGLKMEFFHREDDERICDLHIFQNFLIFGRVLSDETGPVGFQVLVWDLKSVEERWKEQGSSAPMNIEDVKSVFSLHLDIPARSQVHYSQLQCSPSPLHDDTCQLFVLQTLEDGASFDAESYNLTFNESSRKLSVQRGGSLGPFPLERGGFPCNFASSAMHCSCGSRTLVQEPSADAAQSSPCPASLYGRSVVDLHQNTMTVTYYS